MKYLVAVSGGVDSVVLLDMLSKRNPRQLVVAHFDHGIRADSAQDALFVELLAGKYELPFVSRREELGRNASEELARNRRYAFLQSEAKKHNATIVTAHHQNDLLETIAINIYRGTGWRGLAVFGDSTIKRPLLEMTKTDLYVYALKNRLEWVEDSTNREVKYLRNSMRARLHGALVADNELIRLWHSQTKLRGLIDEEAAAFAGGANLPRYFFTALGATVAIEILRMAILGHAGKSLTRPQLERALLAIKTAKPSSQFQAGEGICLRFTTSNFIVEPPQKML